MRASSPKLCLACSGGGHLRQLLLLAEFYQGLDHYFVTQRTPLGESASKDHRIHFVEDVALGLLKKSPRAWRAWFVNLFQSIRILWRERPDVILSSGAGTALNTILLGRLFGARTIFLETFAHTQTPSLTGRIAARFVQAHLVQWEALLTHFPKAALASPLVETGAILERKPSADQVLVTVGTHGPFDRLVREVERLVDQGRMTGPVVAQVGPGGYHPKNMRAFEACGQDEMSRLLDESWLLITHAGTGSILSGLKAGCKVIALARSAAHGEHYDDHQLEILNEMRSRGAVLGGKDPSELEVLWNQASAFQPREIQISVEPIERELARIFGQWFQGWQPAGTSS
jgi:UDP-N-acetylglucosamine transferase subunit ALG13